MQLRRNLPYLKFLIKMGCKYVIRVKFKLRQKWVKLKCAYDREWVKSAVRYSIVNIHDHIKTKQLREKRKCTHSLSHALIKHTEKKRNWLIYFNYLPKLQQESTAVSGYLNGEVGQVEQSIALILIIFHLDGFTLRNKERLRLGHFQN